MYDQLQAIEDRYEELGELLSDPEVISDTKRFMQLSKEEANTRETVDVYRRYKDVVQGIKDTEELLGEKLDDEMAEMAKEELSDLKKEKEELEEKIKILLLPKDPNDDKNIIMEIRGAAGGDDVVHLAFFQHVCHGVAGDGGAHGGLADLLKAQSLERADELHGVVHLERAVEGGRKRRDHVVAALDHALHGLELAFCLLRALGAHLHAGAAGYAQVGHDLGLAGGEANSLDRAGTQAFIAVFAVGLLGFDRAHVTCSASLRFP